MVGTKKLNKKRTNTNLERYKTEHNLNSVSSRNKIKETNLSRYGTTNISSLEEIKQKKKRTKLEKYGNPNYNNRSKFRKTCMEKFGVENPNQNDAVMSKSKSTSFTKKEYKFPSGNIIKIQGYENKAIDHLLKIGIKESEIIVDYKSMPEFWFVYKNKNKRYFPDIFIKRLNWIIEVKSTWTFRLEKELNLMKRKVVKESGYSFNFMIYNK